MTTENDPRGWLTRFLTKGRENTDERTRVMSKEHLDYLDTYLFYGSKEGLEIPMFKELAEINMRLMIAYEGKSREEAVLALQRMFEEKYREVGLQAIMDVFKGKEADQR